MKHFLCVMRFIYISQLVSKMFLWSINGYYSSHSSGKLRLKSKLIYSRSISCQVDSRIQAQGGLVLKPTYLLPLRAAWLTLSLNDAITYGGPPTHSWCGSCSCRDGNYRHKVNKTAQKGWRESQGIREEEKSEKKDKEVVRSQKIGKANGNHAQERASKRKRSPKLSLLHRGKGGWEDEDQENALWLVVLKKMISVEREVHMSRLCVLNSWPDPGTWTAAFKTFLMAQKSSSGGTC